jgi:hypothetical protein
MFIKTLDNKRLLNTAQITNIYISEPEFEQKKYIIYASINLCGNFALAEAETEAEAIQKINDFLCMLNGKKEVRNRKTTDFYKIEIYKNGKWELVCDTENKEEYTKVYNDCISKGIKHRGKKV